MEQKIALAKEFKGPVYVSDVNVDNGIVTFIHNDVEYITEGYIQVDLEHKLVCEYLYAMSENTYGFVTIFDKPKEKYYSDYENSEEEAIHAAESMQAQNVSEMGIITPIMVRQ